MASRKLPMSVKDCLDWVKEKQKSLQGSDYDKNYLGIQQALQRHRNTSAEIKEFSEEIDKHRRSKSRDARDLDQNYKLLEDLDLQKKRCLESMLYVTETESLFQNLEAEVEDRALYLRDRKVVFDSVYRTPDLEISSRIHRDCVYAQRSSWRWLSHVSSCLQAHVQNAARYHQFFHDVQFLDRDMAQFMFWINSGALSRIAEEVSSETLIRVIREMTSHLLDYQTRSERLKEECGEIYPIHKRRDTPQQPIKVKALVNYQNDEIILEENKSYLLVDNSDSELWKVLNKNDVEADVPSIVLVIPPPDGEAVNNSLRLREQVKVHFEVAVQTLRPHLRRFVTQFMDEREAREFERLDDQQRNDIMNLANLAMRLLVDEEGDPEQGEFTDALATVRKFLSQFKGDNRKYRDTDAFLQWKSVEKILITFQELMTYGDVYAEEVAAREQQFVANDNPAYYASKAYFERAKPVELECATQSDFVTKGDIQAELYIYERHREQGTLKRDRLKSEEVQQKLQKTLNTHLAKGLGDTSQETKLFVVKGVFDPRNGERISLDEALARKIINKAHGTFTNPDTFETMPISQAINLGLIEVAVGEAAMNGDTGQGGVDLLHGTSEVKTCPILGVIDPRSGKAISVDQAIAGGILDPESGLYYNPVTREQMSLKEALKKGLIILDARLAEGVANDDAMLSLDSRQRSYKVLGVIDPRTGQKLTLRRAMMSGIIDSEKGVYKNPETGEEMPLAEAMGRGLIVAEEVAPGTTGEGVLTFNELHLRTEKVLAAEPELTAEKDDTVDAVYNLNELVYNKLTESTDPGLKGIKDPLGQYDLTIEEAYNMGILRLDTAEYDRLDGDVIPLQEAAARGLIDPELLKELLKLYSDNSIGELARAGVLDPDTGLVTDPNTGISYSLQSAILQDIVEPDTTFFYDVRAQKITSLTTAIEDQLFNVESAKYRKSPKESVSLAEADKDRIIRCDIDPEKITEHACALAQLRPLINTEQKGVHSPFTQNNVSVEEAIITDILNLPMGKYVDEPANERLPLIASVQNDKIEPDTAMDLFAALDKLSIQQAINENRLDPRTGMWCIEAGRQPAQLSNAPYVDPKFVFFVDNQIGDVTSLAAAIDRGKFEPHTGKFRDNRSGRVFTIEEAIENGMISPRVDPGKCLNVTSTLKDLIDSGKVKPRTTTFVAPNGETMSLRDAMANGFLTMASDVRLDPATGSIVLASDEDVVQSLVEIKETSDWLDSIEQTLAAEQKPNEKPDILKAQLESHKELEGDIVSHEPSVTSAIARARTILNKSKFEKTSDDNQQYQKLKQNITDLGVRFQAAKQEVNTRSETLQDMAEELDMFYEQSLRLEDWIDDAQEKARDLQRSRAGIQTQHDTFRELSEKVKDKEGDLTELVKAVNRFQEGSLDFQKASNNYRKQLHMSPTKPPRASGTSALEEELENVEGKYRDVSRDVSKFADTLGTIVNEKRELEELEDQLDNFYPKVEEALKKVSSGPPSRNPEQTAAKLDTLKSAHAGLVSHSKTLADLGDVADKLSDALGEMNKINEAAEVKKQFKDYQNKHKNLHEAIESRQADLANALSQSRDVSNRLGDVQGWISEADRKLRNSKPISLSMEKLNEQIQEQRLLNADISSHKGVVERVLKETNDPAGSRKVEDVKNKMERLETSAAQRTRDLEEVATRATELQGAASRLETWLDEAIGTLQEKMRSGDRHAVKSKVDELYHEKRNKEEAMQDLKSKCSNLVDDDRVCDTHAPKEVVADVQTKWHELTELLVQQVSLEALTEIDGMLKYLDKAENEINTAEPISVEPDILAVQLRDHHAFNEDLHEKRNSVKDIINKCNRMLRETTNEQTDEIKNRLDSIRTQADIVCQLSDDRLHQLEAAVPLASHFSENHGELSAWLEEMEAELKAQGPAGEDIDQIKKQLDSLKGTQQIIEDHKPFVEDLNATGLEMMEICGDEDAADVQGQLYGINIRYDELKTSARQKSDELSEARKNKSGEVHDNIDSLLEELCQFRGQILAADPIPSNPEKLKDEIEENNIIVAQAKKRHPYIDKAEEALTALKNQDEEEQADIEEMESKLSEVKAMKASIEAEGAAREKALNDAMVVSDKFYDVLTDVTTALRDLKDNILSQEPPGVDAPTVREQIKELEEFKTELAKCQGMVGDVQKIGGQLDNMCGSTGKIEVKKQLEDLAVLLDDVEDIKRDRDEELAKGLKVAENFQNTLDSIMTWLPLSEHKLGNMAPPSMDPKHLQKQTEELQSFKNQIHPHVVDVEALNQLMAALRDTSPMAAESLQRPVQDLNQRWAELVGGIAQRETTLNDMGMHVGKLDSAMDDVINCVTQADNGGQEIPESYADPKCLETRLKRLQLIQKDIQNQGALCRKLNDAVQSLVRESGDENSALRDKRDLMNEIVKTAQVNTHGKQNQLQEALREVKKFVGSIEDLLQWVNELRMELKSPPPLGALPDTAKRQSDAFQKQFEDMLGKEDSVSELVAKGHEILERCKPEDVHHMSEKLRKLQDRWRDTKDRAYRRKAKLQEHSQNVSDFHKTLKGFTEWLTNSEITLKGFVYPSKLVDRVVKQIETHNNFKAEVIKQKEIMEKLDRTGTYLKYFGRKQDTIYIKNLLVGIRLRWKKLLRRVDERGRYLKQAHREDKRFYDAWKALCDWLDQSERKMTRIISQAQSPNKVNQDIDDIKDVVFQQQLNSKHQEFYTATRLGRNLKDRCTKTDPEKEVLQGMLDDLKNKWNFVRSVVSKSQNKLDEALLNSGRVSDALTSLLEWLHRTEDGLSERQPVLGDVDTVNILIEQHRGLQQELVARESTIASMKASGELRNNELMELDSLWERVNHLSDVRENRLQSSLRLAEDFQEVVQIMREFLPQAEGELKVKGLPEDEMAIIQLIERHEKFQEQLRSHQDHVDKIKELAEDILRNCHPNAVRFVKYYLTITQTRWDQILARAKSREERLQDALRSIQGNAALLEELLAWLTDAQVLLATKERDPVPDDLKVVEELVTEHLEFHEDITSKNADVDRLTKVVASEFAKYSQGRNYGSNWKLNEIDTHNPRVHALQNKWRTVWRMSVDRKKRLQDALEQLLELESFKNFDFDLWRQRYMNWIAAKKLRITDFFRRQDKDCDGALTREEFVFGMLQAKFPTNRTELNAVFDIFDRNNTGYIEYREFIEALRPDKHRRQQRGKKPKTESELIHEDIERNVSQCQCRRQFRAEKVDQGKYKFGENQIKLVRFLNTTVMVRVGGGWVTLVQFLEQNDPCRARGRTNVDLRDQLQLPDSSSGRTTPRRYGTPRSVTPSSARSNKKHTTDTGYASSNSSAGSSGNLSSSRRNKTTLSMINLSEVNSTPRRKTEFGSTSDLNRTRRLSDSSSSLASGIGRSTKSSSSKSPAPSSSNRPKTPNYQSPRSAAASPKPRTSTPNRSTTPSSGRSTGRRSRPTTPVQHHYDWR